MQVRLYEFNNSVETGTQPDPGTPTVSPDLITLGYLQSSTVSTFKGGTVTLPIDTQNVTITFSTTFGSTSYVPHASVITTDTDESSLAFYQTKIYAVAASSFKVKLNSAISTANEFLRWSIANYNNP